MTSTLKTEKIQFRGDNSDAITLSSSGGVGLSNIKHTGDTDTYIEFTADNDTKCYSFPNERPEKDWEDYEIPNNQ